MSTVIKASGAVRSQERGSFNFDDMTDRANQYLESVRRQAVDILNQAQQDAVRIRQDAEVQGRAAALKAAEKVLEQQVAVQMSTLLPALNEAVSRIHAAQADWQAHWEKMAIKVAARIAGRVVRRELDRDPKITLTLVREALELAAGRGDVQLRLHPDDFATLGKQVERMTSELAQLGNVKVVADPAISKGGCRVDTRFGFVDQQIEAQIARIEEDLS